MHGFNQNSSYELSNKLVECRSKSSRTELERKCVVKLSGYEWKITFVGRENVRDVPLLQSSARYLAGSCDHVSMDEFEPLNSKFNFPFGERSLVQLGP
jgi:hypothetical protein